MPVTRGLAGPDSPRPARGAAWVGLLRWLNFSAYWLRIGQNHFELMELSAAKPVRTSARAPFSTERLLVGEFSLASRTLTPLVKSLHRRMLGEQPVPGGVVNDQRATAGDHELGERQR